jgi:thiol:disulfide interchange protein
MVAAARRRSSSQLLLLSLLLAVAAARSQQPAPSGFEHHAALAAQQLCPPETGIPAGSGNVVELNELTFQGRIADGRVWLVELYADWCRG